VSFEQIKHYPESGLHCENAAKVQLLLVAQAATHPIPELEHNG